VRVFWRTPPLRALLAMNLVVAALLVLTQDSPLVWPGVLAVWFVLGAATALILTPSARLLRRYSDDTNRPAVFAAQFSLSHACFIITYPLAGILGATLGLAPTALILAAVAVLAGIVAARSWKAPASTKPEETLASPTSTGS